MIDLTITDDAVTRIATILKEEANDMAVRVFVQGGGCSGFQYGFTFDQPSEDDFVIEKEEAKILVDPASYQYLQGSTIDWKKSITGSQFVIQNPNSVGSCGCGSSFAV